MIVERKLATFYRTSCLAHDREGKVITVYVGVDRGMSHEQPDWVSRPATRFATLQEAESWLGRGRDCWDFKTIACSGVVERVTELVTVDTESVTVRTERGEPT